MKKLAAALFVTLASGGVASASLIPTYTGSTTVSGVTTYSYSMVLTTQEQIVSNSTFCFANVLDLTGTATAPTGWTVAQSTSGGCAGGAGILAPNDADSVTYTYTGSTVVGSPTALGTFTFQSTSAIVGTVNVAYAGNTESAGDLTGPDKNLGDVEGPGSNTTPEPASLGLMGGSLIGLAVFSRRLLRANNKT